MKFYESFQAYVEGEKRKLESMQGARIPEVGIIKKVLGPNDRQAEGTNGIYSVTQPVDSLKIDFQGIVGDKHHAAFRDSTARERETYTTGTPIRQHRHIFVVSQYDCDILSGKLNVLVTPELLGANLVIEREDEAPYSISQLPFHTSLLIEDPGQELPSRPPIATLEHQLMQEGCSETGLAIATNYDDSSLKAKFFEAAEQNRGIVFSVEYPVMGDATLEVGQKVFFRFPTGVSV